LKEVVRKWLKIENKKKVDEDIQIKNNPVR